VIRPRDLARAIGPGLPLLVALVGVAVGAMEMLVTRHEALRFSQDGRRVVGQVVLSSGSKYGHGGGRSDKSYCTIGVNDSEIGWQVVQAYGARPVGEAVALICLTVARRCMTVDQVAERMATWPATSSMAIAAVAMGMAVLVWLASRRQDTPSTGEGN
jgi:hypothetical protein